MLFVLNVCGHEHCGFRLRVCSAAIASSVMRVLALTSPTHV